MKLVLQEPYKSIKALPEIELSDFTVLTGVNGAGKSHLLEAIENSSIKVDEIIINDQDNQVRRFDWSSLVPNDSKTIISYELSQERDNDWKTLCSAINEYKYDLIKDLSDYGIKELSDFKIKDLATMSNLELVQVFNFPSQIQDIKNQIKKRYKSFKNSIYNKSSEFGSSREIVISSEFGRGRSFVSFEQLENICNIPLLFINKKDFYENYFKAYYSANIFQQSFSRLFTNYEKMRIDNEFKEFLQLKKRHNIDFISQKEFIEQNGEPPWEFVNSILETANIDFRINKPDLYNDEPYRPQLINQINNDLVDFSDLSSGEKILMSFALCLYYSEDKRQIVNYPKVILFDEIDAPLHPSMTKSILNTIQEILVEKHNIKVILTTHSPSTVALSPESSIYVMTKDSNNRLQKVSKDKALAILTDGIPTLSIEYENRRQVFVESRNDINYYELIYNKIKRELLTGISLNFISTGTNGENCDQVKSIVKQLVDSGNNKVFGIIDWDKKNTSENHIKVLGENTRYSIENYIFDPVLLAAFLLREKLVTRDELGLQEEFIYTDIIKLDNCKLKDIVNWVINKFKEKSQVLNVKVDGKKEIACEYISGQKIAIPSWYLSMQGHKLEEILKKIFPKLNKFSRNRESALKLEILSKVVDDLPTLLSKDFIDLFLDIQEASN